MGHHSIGRCLDFLENIRLRWVTDLAYYDVELITAVKILLVQPPPDGLVS